jgi:predicted DNA binding CopG/RHH family protein
MAKKNLGDIEDNNKNLGGVSALFNSPSKEIPTKAGKPEPLAEEETVTYPLRLKKSALKALKILAAQRGVTVKELILSVVDKAYDL